MQKKNEQGTQKNSQDFFFQTWPGFFAMPVCLKSGIIAKPLYIRIHKCVFRFVVAMCKLCNFFEFLSFKITELLPVLGYLIPILPHNLIIWHTTITIWHACIWQPCNGTTGVIVLTMDWDETTADTADGSRCAGRLRRDVTGRWLRWHWGCRS